MQQTLERITNWLPQLAAAIVVVLLGWLVAALVRLVVRKGLQRMKVDERLSDHQGPSTDATSMTRTLSEGAFWVVFLLFVPMIMDILGLNSLFDPFSEMAAGFLAFLPNLVGAALIMVVGFFLARFVRRVSSRLLASAGVDRFDRRTGVESGESERRLSNLLGLVAYVLVLIPVAVAALHALNLQAVTIPASEMLRDVLIALPAMFGAAVIISIAYVVGQVVKGIVARVLVAIGFDRMFQNLGMWSPQTKIPETEMAEMPEMAEGQPASTTLANAAPSDMIGAVAFIGIVLVGITASLRLMEFTVLQTMVADFMVFAAQILLGLAIFVIGVLLANWAARMVKSSEAKHSVLLAQLARAGVLILAGAIALRQMGIANEIITLAFAFIVGAVAVAAGIAFGVGGREVAADVLADWRDRIEREEEPLTR